MRKRKTNAHKILIVKSEGKRRVARPTRKCKDNTRMYLKINVFGVGMDSSE